MFGFPSHSFIYTLPVVIDELGYSATDAVSQEIAAVDKPLLTGSSATPHHSCVHCSRHSYGDVGVFF